MDGYCDHCKTVFEAMGCYYHFCSGQEVSPSSTDNDSERGNKGESWRICDENTLKRKNIKLKKNVRASNGKNLKPMTRSKNSVRTNFPYKKPLSTDSLLVKIKDGSLFGHIQSDVVVPDELNQILGISSNFQNY